MVYQQTRRWIHAGVFEELLHDLREIIRLSDKKNAQPSAMIIDSRTLQSTPESGDRAGYDGTKRRKGSKVQPVTGESVEIAYADQGYTGASTAEQAQAHGIRLEVVKHTQAKKGFVLLPRRWVVERSFGWMARFRRLSRDYERLSQTLADFHFIAFVCLMLPTAIKALAAPG